MFLEQTLFKMRQNSVHIKQEVEIWRTAYEIVFLELPNEHSDFIISAICFPREKKHWWSEVIRKKWKIFVTLLRTRILSKCMLLVIT